MILLFAILALGYPVSDTTAISEQLVDATRTVITRDDIEAAGLYRIADLFQLIEDARVTTVDGYTWRVSLLDGDPFGTEGWTLFMDGDRVDMDLLGETNLSLLPVAVTHIDSVEVWSIPRLTAGHFASGGSIHIHTTRAETTGVGMRVASKVGAQNGDSGPFRYIPEMATLNVDKFGPDYEGLVVAAGDRWNMNARFKLIRFYPTHETAFDRNTAILNGADTPRARFFSAAARFDADVAGGRHSVQLFGGRHNDLWFYAPYGRELSTRRFFGQAALRGSYDLPIVLRNDASPSVTYRLSATQDQLDKRFDQSLGPDPALDQRTLSAGLEVNVPLGNLGVITGGSFEHRNVTGAQGVGITRLFGAVTRQRATGQEHLALSLAASDGDLAANAAFNSTHLVGFTTIAAHGSISQRLPVEIGRLAFWSARGYDAFDDVIELHQSSAQVMTVTQVRLDASHRLGSGLRASAGIGFRTYHNLYVEYQTVAPDPDELDVERISIATSNVSGNVMHGRGSLDIRQGPWTGRLWLNAQIPIGNDEIFEQSWQRVARYRTGIRGAVKPVASFVASASLGFHSGSYWPEYDYLGESDNHLYNPAIPSAWLFEVALDKWFWNERLRASLSYKNILGEEERYHPIGASLNRRFSLRVEMQL